MKILILANPRTGSTYLGQWLSNRYDIPYIHEPEFIDELTTSLNTLDNFCIKIAIPQLYYYNRDNKKLSESECIDYFYNLISKYKFDTILILDRKNTNEYIESIINLNRKSNTEDGFKEWVYDSNFKNSITPDEWNKWSSWTMTCKNWLKSISNKFNIPIIQYEDLYYNPKSVDLGGLEFNPYLRMKLRKNSSNSII